MTTANQVCHAHDVQANNSGPSAVAEKLTCLTPGEHILQKHMIKCSALHIHFICQRL